MSFGVLTRGKTARAFFDDLQIRHEIENEALRGEATAVFREELEPE